MKDLFSGTPQPQNEPLASRMRPRSLDEFVGQDHILGPGRLLRRAIQADRLSSVIFAGPPGTGKTTLARVIANTTKSAFVTLNAVLSGVKDLREAIDAARRDRELYGGRTILFVDEVHRWNKAQQDALLPWVENGTVILIGATTENPFFEVNSALVSRSRIFQLIPLDQGSLRTIARRALSDPDRGYGRFDIEISEDALDHLVTTADGDARNLLGALELAVETTPARFPPPAGERIVITRETAEESIQKKVVLYDKEGDYHYDVISAFIKSVRGSDPDAALYWLARMVVAGEDPRFILRRLLILASEDVGMGDPGALGVVAAAAAAFDRVGMPEGQYHLTQATLYCATAPKSNSGMAYFDARRVVEEEAAAAVPKHIRDSNRDAAGFGHGEGYLYPHAYRDHWVSQDYLPAGLKGRLFYRPSNVGYEASIRDAVVARRAAQLETAAALDDEVLTYTGGGAASGWLRRALSAAAEDQVLDTVLDRASLPRHATVLVLDRVPGPALASTLRRVPEGGVWALVPSQEDLDGILTLLSGLSELEAPRIHVGSVKDFSTLPEEADRPGRFEAVVGRPGLPRIVDRVGFFAEVFALTAPGGRVAFTDRLPREGMRLSRLEAAAELDASARKRLAAAETQIYENAENPAVNWSIQDLAAWAAAAGFADVVVDRVTKTTDRILSADEIEAWLKPPKPYTTYATLVAAGTSEAVTLRAWITGLAGRSHSWTTASFTLSARRDPG